MPTIHNHTVIPVDPRTGTSTVASESIGDFAARLVGLPGKLANIDHFNDLGRDYGVAHGLDYGTAVKHVKVHAYAWADDYKGGNQFVYNLRAKMHRGWTENQTKAILNCMRADPAGDRSDSPSQSNGGGWQSQPREEHVIWSGGTLPSLDDSAWDHVFNPDGEEIHVPRPRPSASTSGRTTGTAASPWFSPPTASGPTSSSSRTHPRKSISPASGSRPSAGRRWA